MTVLELKGVTIAYNGLKAVEAVNLQVNAGEYLSLLGANGSGKSTLLKGILGLLPLASGTVTLALGHEAISYLPQVNPVERGFPATVEEIVLTGTQKKGRRLPFYSRQDRDSAREALATLDITALAGARIGTLSGGQQQRVMLARALGRRPQMLLLDEPCAGLDPRITGELYALLAKLNQEQGITIIMASHDPEEITRYASRIVVLNRSVEFDGSVEQWKHSQGQGRQ